MVSFLNRVVANAILPQLFRDVAGADRFGLSVVHPFPHVLTGIRIVMYNSDRYSEREYNRSERD
jgi:hypothetical protein